MATRPPSVGDFLSDASFWRPDYTCASAWLEHSPFAFWLVEALRPGTFVELGTHTGFSYLCLCQAAVRAKLRCRGFAIDHWRGDEQTGFYGEEVFSELAAYHDPRYSAFSTLLRSTFEDAATSFEDGSIDLLHIDGLHGYEAVRHDFDTWRPKLSSRAVVLLHDTSDRQPGFGVYRVWAELHEEHAAFEFEHGHGLGVLGVGSDLPPRLRRLLAAESTPRLVAEVRHAYSRLGAAILLELQVADLTRKADLARAETEAAQERASGLERELGRVRERATMAERELAAARAAARQLASELEGRLASPPRERALEVERTPGRRRPAS